MVNNNVRVYVHTGKGHWLGSVVVVLAHNLEHARRLVRKELDRVRLDSEELNIKLHPKREHIIYIDNGDY